MVGRKGCWPACAAALTGCVCCTLRQLVHLDLKSANVLLQDKNFSVAKIADLGLSKYMGDCSVLDHTMRARSPCLHSRELC